MVSNTSCRSSELNSSSTIVLLTLCRCSKRWWTKMHALPLGDTAETWRCRRLVSTMFPSWQLHLFHIGLLHAGLKRGVRKCSEKWSQHCFGHNLFFFRQLFEMSAHCLNLVYSIYSRWALGSEDRFSARRNFPLTLHHCFKLSTFFFEDGEGYNLPLYWSQQLVLAKLFAWLSIVNPSLLCLWFSFS